MPLIFWESYTDTRISSISNNVGLKIIFPKPPHYSLLQVWNPHDSPVKAKLPTWEEAARMTTLWELRKIPKLMHPANTSRYGTRQQRFQNIYCFGRNRGRQNKHTMSFSPQPEARSYRLLFTSISNRYAWTKKPEQCKTRHSYTSQGV